MQHTVVRAEPQVEEYLKGVRLGAAHLAPEERDRIISLAQARVELELELEGMRTADGEAAALVLKRLGPPEQLVASLRAEAEPAARRGGLDFALLRCHVCRAEVAPGSGTCSACGCREPLAQRGTGRDWKSKQTLWGLPLVHVATGKDELGRRRVARGIIAIGQFAVGGLAIGQVATGVVAIGQIARGLVAVGQLAIGLVAVGQLALGLFALGQLGLGLLFGIGLMATGLNHLSAVPFAR